MANNYARDNTTIKDREEIVINKNNPINSSKHKMSDYLSQDNVKSFNRIVVSRNFEKLHDKHKRKATEPIFNDYDECLEEVEGYFKLCDTYNIIPTIASLSLYLGIHRDTIYTMANNPRTYKCSDIVKSAIATCQAYHESAFMSNEISPVSFIFYSKNYYGLKDTTDVRFNQDNTDNTISSDSMIAIREQIENEKQHLLVDDVNK